MKTLNNSNFGELLKWVALNVEKRRANFFVCFINRGKCDSGCRIFGLCTFLRLWLWRLSHMCVHGWDRWHWYAHVSLDRRGFKQIQGLILKSIDIRKWRQKISVVDHPERYSEIPEFNARYGCAFFSHCGFCFIHWGTTDGTGINFWCISK